MFSQFAVNDIKISPVFSYRKEKHTYFHSKSLSHNVGLCVLCVCHFLRFCKRLIILPFTKVASPITHCKTIH